MIHCLTREPRLWRLGLTGGLLAATVLACGGQRVEIPPPQLDADRLLFERGMIALEERDWRRAREYFVQIRDNYPQSEHRADARLAIGDTYEGEGSLDAYIQALDEYQDFLSLYPTHPRAAYAQYKVGLVHFQQMRRAERDQTETITAIQEFETFITRFPDHQLMSEVRQRLREARDRLSEHDYVVGYFYYRAKNYAGAISRFRQILDDDPAYTRRDEVYFHLAESLAESNQLVEAIPYFARLLDEFEASEYAEQAKVRMAELEVGAER
ncbi:MAG: outer membrane protein assembly factor BamD [Acidobacteria bacterium]|nr:outer membrane protein assembly factor BamD [Acidobacteriota bacterium]